MVVMTFQSTFLSPAAQIADQKQMHKAFYGAAVEGRRQFI